MCSFADSSWVFDSSARSQDVRRCSLSLIVRCGGSARTDTGAACVRWRHSTAQPGRDWCDCEDRQERGHAGAGASGGARTWHAGPSGHSSLGHTPWPLAVRAAASSVRPGGLGRRRRHETASACGFSALAERSVQYNTFATWKFAKNALSCPDGSLPHHRRVKLPIDRGSTAWRHLPRRRYQALFFGSAEGI